MSDLVPDIADVVPWSDEITLYDREHLIIYARLLDDWEFANWREAARIALLQDPDEDPEKARLCWESHLERAKWIATTGFAQAVARAKAH